MKVGILITHGTDTLAWTLPYIRYAIKNNHANICLTGSQIPLPASGAFSDAFLNLQNSMRFLSTLQPPNVFAVFNYGRDAFSDSLRKIDRWDCNAFAGDLVARMEWDEVKYHDQSLTVLPPFRLDKFHLITTGGTIDSEPDELGILSPGKNHALGYITTNFSEFFEDLSRDPVFSLDSSDISLPHLERLAKRVEKCLQESHADTVADCRFDPGVRIVYTDPFKSARDYARECEGASGIVIAGYGGGNINIQADEGYSPLPLIERLTAAGVPVVVTSQVPLGTADFVYENGARAIRAGAIPGVDLSLPETQLRLSYILGHRDELRSRGGESATSAGHLGLVKRLFLSGVKYRNRRSCRLAEILTGVAHIEDDLLIDRPFEEAVAAITA